MTNAYSESYLDDAMKSLGEAFDYAVNACGIDADDFADMFIAGGLANSFGKGSPRLISGLSGTELVMETVSRAGLDITFPPAQTEYDCSPEYWCGWVLAYYQWKKNISFKNLHELISMDEVLGLYPVLHEASEDKFVDTLDKIALRKRLPSRLQRQRKICGYSQKELAEKSGVNLRTLQQYELKTKDLGKASFKTASALANALGCGFDDIMETV